METVDLTPHPSLGLAYRCIQALRSEGFSFEQEGEELEGLALVAIASVLISAEKVGLLAFPE